MKGVVPAFMLLVITLYGCFRAATPPEERARIKYAIDLEQDFLRHGVDVRVVADGPRHTHLTCKLTEATRSFALHSKEFQDLRIRLFDLGFTKMALTDGRVQDWSWDITSGEQTTRD